MNKYADLEGKLIDMRGLLMLLSMSEPTDRHTLVYKAIDALGEAAYQLHKLAE